MLTDDFSAPGALQARELKSDENLLPILNVLGQQVRTLVNEIQEMGTHAVVWNGRDDAGRAVASGMYMYRLEVEGKYVEGRQMLLVR